MTVSMLTTRLSEVITGCGGKDTTCSRRSTLARTLSTNGIRRCRPRLEGAGVAGRAARRSARSAAARSGWSGRSAMTTKRRAAAGRPAPALSTRVHVVTPNPDRRRRLRRSPWPPRWTPPGPLVRAGTRRSSGAVRADHISPPSLMRPSFSVTVDRTSAERPIWAAVPMPLASGTVNCRLMTGRHERAAPGPPRPARRAPGPTTAAPRAAASAPARAPPASMRKTKSSWPARRRRARARCRPRPASHDQRTTSCAPASLCSLDRQCRRSDPSPPSNAAALPRVPSGADVLRPCGPAVAVPLDVRAAARTSRDRFSAVSVVLDRARRDDPPLAQQQHVGERRRDLLDVVGDQHQRRRVGSRGEHGRAGATRSSRPPRSRPAAGSSSSISSGSVISARAICTRLRSPSLSVPKVRSARCPAPSASSSSSARGVVQRRRSCSRQRPTTPYDAVTTTSRDPLAAGQPLGECRRWPGRSGAAARRRRPRRGPRRGRRRPRAWGASGRRRAAAGWSCRRRWARG